MQNTAASVIFYRKNKIPFYLLLRYNIFTQKHFDFVKGKLEKSEEFLDAAKREIVEETGIKNFKRIKGFCEEYIYSFKKDNGDQETKKVKYFLFEINKKDSENLILSEEHDKFLFVNFKKALRVLEFENQKEIITKANNYLIKIQ